MMTITKKSEAISYLDELSMMKKEDPDEVIEH